MQDENYSSLGEGTVSLEVKLLDLAWFYADRNNFVSFCPQLQGLQHSVYGSEFVSCMLE